MASIAPVGFFFFFQLFGNRDKESYSSITKEKEAV